jgi:hypothetical protein
MRLSPRSGLGGLLVALVFAASFGAVGCGSSTGTVSGKVYYKNTPLKGGSVVFWSADKTVSKSGQIGEDGSYKVEKVPAQEMTVCVDTSTLKPAMGSKAPPKYNAPPGMTMPGAEKRTYRAEMATRYVWIPDDYSKPEKSTKKYKVTSGAQEYDIKLE